MKQYSYYDKLGAGLLTGDADADAIGIVKTQSKPELDKRNEGPTAVATNDGRTKSAATTTTTFS